MNKKVVSILLSIVLAVTLLMPSVKVKAEPGAEGEAIENLDNPTEEPVYEEQPQEEQVQEEIPITEEQPAQTEEQPEEAEQEKNIIQPSDYDTALYKVVLFTLGKSEGESITLEEVASITEIDIEELQKNHDDLKDITINSFDLLDKTENLQKLNLGNAKWANLAELDNYLYLDRLNELTVNGCTFTTITVELLKKLSIEGQSFEDRVLIINLGENTITADNKKFDIPEIKELKPIEQLPDEDKANALGYKISESENWILENFAVETTADKFDIDKISMEISLTKNNKDMAIIKCDVLIDSSLIKNGEEKPNNPGEEEKPPVEEPSNPGNEEKPPVEEPSNPGDEEKPPVEEPSNPGDEENPPAEEPSKPGDEEKPPVEEPSNPGEGENLGEEDQVDKDSPKITAEDITINVGEEFDPKKIVSAVDKDGNDITDSIEIKENTVDTNKTGKYVVTYLVKDKDGIEATKTIYVTVKDGDEEVNSSPIIEAENKSINVGDKFDPWDGVKATDEEDGDITDRIVILANTVDPNTPGSYIVTYEVKDKVGATARKTIDVVVVKKSEEKNEAPVINASDRVIKYGSNFNPLTGVTAYDKEDGDITSKIVVVQNLVDVYTRGKYSVTYKVVDSKNEECIKVINVEVKDKEEPINRAPKIYVYDQIIKLGNKFNPYSIVRAYDYEDGNITSSVAVISNTVNINVVGFYNVTYEVTDSNGYRVTKTIFVNVIPANNTRPVIYVSDVTIGLGNRYNPYAMVRAYDKEDGNITSKIIVLYNYVNIYKEGKYKVGYSVTDSMGSTASWEITVRVKGNSNINSVVTNETPVLYANNISIPLDSKFNPLEWVAATDKEDGDITNRVMVISNEVDTSTEGNYHVTYEVIDSAGNKANKVMMVYVKKESDIKENNTTPTIYAENITLEKGSYFDPLDGVNALDEEDGNLNHKLVVKENNVDITKPGVYKVTYEVTDSMDEVATKTIEVTVIGGNSNFMIAVVCGGIGALVLIIAAIVVVVVTKKRK